MTSRDELLARMARLHELGLHDAVNDCAYLIALIDASEQPCGCDDADPENAGGT